MECATRITTWNGYALYHHRAGYTIVHAASGHIYGWAKTYHDGLAALRAWALVSR